MAQAQVGDLVRVHYTGRLADGTTFDTSMEREPLEFTLGEGELIPGFEQAVLGMIAGESKTATILSDQAYGPHHAERVIDVERHHLPPDLQPEIGQRLDQPQALVTDEQDHSFQPSLLQVPRELHPAFLVLLRPFRHRQHFAITFLVDSRRRGGGRESWGLEDGRADAGVGSGHNRA